jgi:glycosyltransferase involved in cell wall biosynthesis
VVVKVKPLVSVGLPVHNGERFIAEAIESILGQSYTDIELIISDNASSDRTGDICRGYAARDARVKYSRNEINLGAADNYNRVFELSSGRYFKWAAHDDVCAPEFVARCVELLERDDSVVLCYTTSIFIDEDGKALREYVEDVDYTDPRADRRLRTWLMDRPGGWCNLVFGVIRSSALRQTGLIGKYCASDYVLVGELALLGKLYRIPEALFFRRDHPKRSALAYAGADRTAVWYDSAASTGGVRLPTWRLFGEYWKASVRVPVAIADRIRASGVVMRWAVRVRSKLRQEIVAAVCSVARKKRAVCSSVE